MNQEEEKFRKALKKGLAYLNSWGKKKGANTVEAEDISGEEIGELAFYMYESYGFPIDDTLDEITNMGWDFDKMRVREIAGEKFEKHQELSRQGAEKKFGGHGLLLQTGELKAADEEELEKVTALHTATHLLHEALREVLGEHVQQKGSDISAERLRFDFAHPEKMTDEEKEKVESLVNEQIQKGLAVDCEEMSLEKAEKSGALGFFKDKYKDIDRLKVYSVGGFSKEICGGPHVASTKDMGEFKIKKESSSSAGVRRIKAILH